MISKQYVINAMNKVYLAQYNYHLYCLLLTINLLHRNDDSEIGFDPNGFIHSMQKMFGE